ncbi:Hypothetical protein SMAX5B_000950 [Scophthalmus maximus]|uniref:Uncharacterized protein n=1 Tax=Scophthalmus maximus TaxID=52904 RepID=A0A2U9C7J1_SCOMX|nr:Hypothetical protein SMAX5B_000950 [Scophthalmus maximus]
MSSHEGDSPVVASLKSTTLKDISGRYSGEIPVSQRRNNLVKKEQSLYQGQSLAPKKVLNLNSQAPPKKKTSLETPVKNTNKGVTKQMDSYRGMPSIPT